MTQERDLEETVASFPRRRISRVRYCGFQVDPTDWDFGTWHQPVMGVEIEFEGGGPTYSVLWGNTYGHFNIEVVAERMKAALRLPSEPYDELDDGRARVWDVTSHARWASLILEPLVHAKVIWQRDVTDVAGLAPVAVGLWFLDGPVWIAAAAPSDWPPEERYGLGADEIMVIFSPTFAKKMGLVGSEFFGA